MDLHQALLALQSVRFAEEDGRGPTRLRRAVIRHLDGWEEIGHDGSFLPIVTRNARSKSPLSGFSAAPTFSSTWSKRALLDAYGYRDKNGHERALFVELEDLESTQRDFGLQAAYGALEVRERSSRDLICLWSLDTLLEKFGKHEQFLCLEFNCSPIEATLSSASIRTRKYPIRTSMMSFGCSRINSFVLNFECTSRKTIPIATTQVGPGGDFETTVLVGDTTPMHLQKSTIFRRCEDVRTPRCIREPWCLQKRLFGCWDLLHRACASTGWLLVWSWYG